MLPRADGNPDGQQSIVDSLESDHTAISDLLHDREFAAATARGEQLREQLIMTVIRHFVAEEEYLYPQVRKHAQDGDALASAQFTADRAIEHELKKLEHGDLTAENLSALVADLGQRFEQHHAVQRHEMFPALISALDPATLAALGAEVRGAEQIAPTRPRGVVPSSSELNRIFSVVEGFVDHVRDAYSKRGINSDDA